MATAHPVIVTSIKLDIADMIKKQRDLWVNKGFSQGQAINGIAKAMGKTPAFVYSQLSITELPNEIVGIMRTKPIAIALALKVWKDSEGNIRQAKNTLLLAFEKAKYEGASKVMPKHLN